MQKPPADISRPASAQVRRPLAILVTEFCISLYLYVSFTNATAFSPTDTMPLSRWAKMLMAVQAAVALITVALVVARAVNILK